MEISGNRKGAQRLAFEIRVGATLLRWKSHHPFLSLRAKLRDLQFPIPGHNDAPKHETRTKVFYNQHRA
jgi:hypothetical protein